MVKKFSFFFNDNTFNVDHKRIELFCNKLIENKNSLEYIYKG